MATRQGTENRGPSNKLFPRQHTYICSSGYKHRDRQPVYTKARKNTNFCNWRLTTVMWGHLRLLQNSMYKKKIWSMKIKVSWDVTGMIGRSI